SETLNHEARDAETEIKLYPRGDAAAEDQFGSMLHMLDAHYLYALQLLLLRKGRDRRKKRAGDYDPALQPKLQTRAQRCYLPSDPAREGRGSTIGNKGDTSSIDCRKLTTTALSPSIDKPPSGSCPASRAANPALL